MDDGLTVVLDVGKTLTKLSLWSQSGVVIARETRANQRVDAGAYAALDALGIETWAAGVLKDFATRGRVSGIVPVAHGAALAVLRNGKLACSPPDYEAPVPLAVRAAYDLDRDPFSLTGSPRLPDGLNCGVQLAWLETQHPGLVGPGATVVTWAQYWAWLFCGVAATELTSLGCHSDLWRPFEAQPSGLAVRRGWVGLFAPLRAAGDVLGALTPAWAERTGLPADTKVYCGLHDSNAALLAARGFPEIAQHDSTVLSTGTWFVAMRSPARPADVDTRRIDIKPDQPDLLAAVPAVANAGSRALPTFTPGAGPFPSGHGRWIDRPTDAVGQRTAVCLYAALVADSALDLIGARKRILVEGRFAEAQVFVRALASLRPRDTIYMSNAQHDVSYGALRLLNPQLEALSSLERALPLETDLQAYASRWRRDARIAAP